ncbi:hypothetical protein HPC49_07965 [Pyxidicoccus fallax]|uniref:Uncharacterized protein n=1 Tax=Pyxidicoccus fallax TaxID=394095 RepID=A0A848L6U8_9BACT|nr:hypothetical protein [Pyxidicoccus fallax]NMO14247.1 hypothetical protein [Pyxidicoccus fallax]NPC78189.1 hypothetical protein [Pyxidicoccus fallax]
MRTTIIAGISLTSLLASSALAGAGDISSLQGTGAFNTIQDIKNYDAATQGSQRRVTFVDGAMVQDLFGFGPAEITEYFRCSDNKYRFQCWDPYSRAPTWDGSLLSLFSGADTRIYIDGSLYQSNTGAWGQTVHITTCYGDSSPVMSGPYRSYRVTFWQTLSGTFINRTCATP